MILVIWPRWPSCSYMVKTFKNFSETSRPMTFQHGIWFQGLEPTKYLEMMILAWPWPTLQQGQLCSLMFLYGKMLNYLVLEKLLKSLNWKRWVHVYEYIWVPEVKVIVWPLSKATQIYAFNILPSYWTHQSQISCRAFMIRGERKFF